MTHGGLSHRIRPRMLCYTIPYRCCANRFESRSSFFSSNPIFPLAATVAFPSKINPITLARYFSPADALQKRPAWQSFPTMLRN